MGGFTGILGARSAFGIVAKSARMPGRVVVFKVKYYGLGYG